MGGGPGGWAVRAGGGCSLAGDGFVHVEDLGGEAGPVVERCGGLSSEGEGAGPVGVGEQVVDRSGECYGVAGWDASPVRTAPVQTRAITGRPLFPRQAP